MYKLQFFTLIFAVLKRFIQLVQSIT